MLFPRIRNMREDKDLSQSEIAKILNCAQRTYSGYECGQRSIPIESIIILAKFYGTSVDYLLGLTDNPLPYDK